MHLIATIWNTLLISPHGGGGHGLVDAANYRAARPFLFDMFHVFTPALPPPPNSGFHDPLLPDEVTSGK